MSDSTFLEPLTNLAEPQTAATPEALSLREQVNDACQAWLTKTPSLATRENYQRDLQQFKMFAGIPEGEPERLVRVKPAHVSAWRDQLSKLGLSASSIRRKLTVLRSLYSYLQTYGYAGTNPAHGDFVAVPPVPRDGKTVGLSPEDCRRLLDAPSVLTAAGVRDQALLGVLAYTGCRVGELARYGWRLQDDRRSQNLGHRWERRQMSAGAVAPRGLRAAGSMARKGRHK